MRNDLDGYFSSPQDAPPKWLAMLTVYLDESGQESKDWQFIAGFLGNSDQWAALASKWSLALGNRKRLHMKELRWNDRRAERRIKPLLERLAQIPEQCGLIPIVGGVRFADYEDLLSGTPWEKILSGYMHCLFALVTQILRVTPPDERIEFVFEAQDKYEPYANDAFNKGLALPDHHFSRTSDGRPKIAKWGFVPKNSTVLLQPADYLAFALRAAWTDKHSRQAQWCLPLLASCDHAKRGVGSIMDRSRVRKLLQTTKIIAEVYSIRPEEKR